MQHATWDAHRATIILYPSGEELRQREKDLIDYDGWMSMKEDRLPGNECGTCGLFFAGDQADRCPLCGSEQ